MKNAAESISEDWRRKNSFMRRQIQDIFQENLIGETEKEHPEVKVTCATKRENHGRTVSQILEVLPETMPDENKESPMTTEKMRYFLWVRRSDL